MFDHVYAEQTPELAQQRAEFVDYHASFEERVTDGAQTLTIGKALNLGLRKALEDDPKVVLMGEDIGKLGGSSASPTACRRTSASSG